MDDLTPLTRHRPDPAPPTDAELAAIRARLGDHITAPDAPRARDRDHDPEAAEIPIALDAAPRPPRSRRGLVLAAGAAAVLVALVVARAPDTGRETATLADGPATTRPVSTEPGTAAPVGPDEPASLEAHVSAETTGGTGADRTVDGVVVEHRVQPGVWVFDLTGCPECDPTATSSLLRRPPPGATADEVRDEVDSHLALAVDTRGELVGIATALLRHTDPVLRAALLDALDATTSTAEPVTTSLGAEGVRYSATGEGQSYAVTIDPADGFVLEVASVSEPGATGLDAVTTPAGQLDGSARVEVVVAYTRPVGEDAVPAHLAPVVDLARSQVPEQGCTGAHYPDAAGPVPGDTAYISCA